MSQLQNAQIVVVAVDDLQSNLQPGFSECTRDRYGGQASQRDGITAFPPADSNLALMEEKDLILKRPSKQQA